MNLRRSIFSCPTANRVAANVVSLCLASLLALNVNAEEPAKQAAPAAAPAPTAQQAAVPAQAAAPAAKTVATTTKAKAKPAAPVEPPECIRTGQRVIAALARDDSGAASQFHKFYEAFRCPPTRLAQAFGCLVNLQEANPGLNNPTPDQVEGCWDDPTTLPKVEAPKPAGQ